VVKREVHAASSGLGQEDSPRRTGGRLRRSGEEAIQRVWERDILSRGGRGEIGRRHLE